MSQTLNSSAQAGAHESTPVTTAQRTEHEAFMAAQAKVKAQTMAEDWNSDTDIEVIDAKLDVESGGKAAPVDNSRSGGDFARDPYIPWRQCLLIYAITATSSLSVGSPIPLFPEMAREVFDMSPEHASMAVGMLQGSTHLANFMASFYAGHLSDKLGRKPVLMIGIMSNVLLLVTFGFSPAFWVALVNRAMVGMLDCNATVGKAYLGDIATEANRAIVFAYWGGAFSLARAVGCGMTGVVSRGFEDADIPWTFVLPCWFSAVPMIVACICIMLWLPESHDDDKRKPPALLKGLGTICQDPVLTRLLMSYGLNSFCNGAMLLGLLVFMSTPVTSGGMGFDAFGTGIVIGSFGLASFAYQFTCFKWVQSKISIHNAYSWVGCGSASLACVLFPMAGFTKEAHGEVGDIAYNPFGARNDVVSYVLLVAAVVTLAVGFMSMLPLLNSLISGAADPASRGLTQGTAQSMGGLVRALGPILMGVMLPYLFDSKPYYIFLFLGIAYLTAMILSRSIKKRDETPLLEVELSRSDGGALTTKASVASTITGRRTKDSLVNTRTNSILL
eukprot:GFYU01007968.1.p1 GENE.GFYU01007968.1~~GFYU01007968.1.p1  ORF type:complete len:559 (-),score=132.82 GFYU01007968.1:51-1727(-)